MNYMRSTSSRETWEGIQSYEIFFSLASSPETYSEDTRWQWQLCFLEVLHRIKNMVVGEEAADNYSEFFTLCEDKKKHNTN